MVLRNIFKLVLVLLLVACNNSDDNDGITPESSTYEFFEDSRMTFAISQTSDVFEIETGTNTVFKYAFTAEDNEDISDDEYTESIYFEIDGNLDSFTYAEAELQNLNLFIQRSCFCANTSFVFIDSGTISGTKLSNGNWDLRIFMNLQWDEFSENETRIINGVFQLTSL